VNTQLGRTDDAEKAFAKIVALGLATNSLSVKFLYRPGSLEFLADPKISGPYTMWVRLIAREVASSGVCLTIVGHTSKTGTEQFNERLSLQRAVTMQRRIEAQAAETTGRLQSVGMGFRENIGIGTDDLGDSLDRRVELQPASAGLESSGSDAQRLRPGERARREFQRGHRPAEVVALGPVTVERAEEGCLLGLDTSAVTFRFKPGRDDRGDDRRVVRSELMSRTNERSI
jgi:hypothetical protein